MEAPSVRDRRRLLRDAASPVLAAARVTTPPRATARGGPVRPMRRPGEHGPPTKDLPAPPEAGVIALSRLGFGPRPGDLAAFRSLGPDDPSRLTAWVDQQLAPATIDDSACDAIVAAAGFSTLSKSQSQLWQDHVVADPSWEVRMQPLIEVERLTFLRAVHSERQLLEVLAGFWHDHFNVYGWEYWVGPLWSWWDREVIRGNALGNFRQMLGMVAESPPMLYYLDNYTSSDDGPNENYARELFELHTLGAESYLGVLLQADVPTDLDGRPVGYVDEDVFEATRCFTGWTFDFDTGHFEYRADWHDPFQKHVLGLHMPSNQPPLKDGSDVLDALAAHPGTGRHIARKLCRKLIGEDPPANVVDAAAQVFTDHWQAPDQIAQTVRTIVLSSELRSTWGTKIKRPFEIAVSALRAIDGRLGWSIDESTTDSFLWLYDQAGQPLFSWRSPDGFPDLREDWQSTTPRVMSWRLVNWLVDEETDDVHLADIVGQTPPGVRSANDLADFWIDRVLSRPMPPAERTEIVELMAQGYNPDLALPLDTDEDTRERLRAMVGLILMSPAFLWR